MLLSLMLLAFDISFEGPQKLLLGASVPPSMCLADRSRQVDGSHNHVYNVQCKSSDVTWGPRCHQCEESGGSAVTHNLPCQDSRTPLQIKSLPPLKVGNSTKITEMVYNTIAIFAKSLMAYLFTGWPVGFLILSTTS